LRFHNRSMHIVITGIVSAVVAVALALVVIKGGTDAIETHRSESRSEHRALMEALSEVYGKAEENGKAIAANSRKLDVILNIATNSVCRDFN